MTVMPLGSAIHKFAKSHGWSWRKAREVFGGSYQRYIENESLPRQKAIDKIIDTTGWDRGYVEACIIESRKLKTAKEKVKPLLKTQSIQNPIINKKSALPCTSMDDLLSEYVKIANEKAEIQPQFEALFKKIDTINNRMSEIKRQLKEAV